MKGLYAIVDTKLLLARKMDPVAYARAVLAVRPAALQVRAKDRPAREILALLRAIGPLCRMARVPLVANDRADLAALGGCQMVHIGQDDLPYELVHRIAPQLGVGISTHTEEQLDRALAARPSYVAFGPVFATANKLNPDPVVGVRALEAAARTARKAGIPLVAIGGITLGVARDLAPFIDACAVIGDLFPEGATLADVTERARLFHLALGGPPAVGVVEARA
jgi:thiamine-phosphate pyrophosphorylase